jgi:3-hydroxyacyl-[acyl-carrier-protein] dehydratase
MLEIQPNQEPFLFINNSLKVKHFESATCTLKLSPNEWFFKCHWPGNPNMPAALQLETMTQVGGMILFCSLENKPKHLYVRKIANAVFFRKILPNTEITIISESIKYHKGIMSVKSKIKCKKTDLIFSKSEFSLINPEVIPKVS